MQDITKLSPEEMINDYYTSLMDARTCESLLIFGENETLRNRLDGNYRIMAIIDLELDRRKVKKPWESKQ